MATVRFQNDMTALLQFLECDDFKKVNPKEKKKNELITAINDINNNIRVKEALVVLKTALSEEGWLMAELVEHTAIAAFQTAFKVCVCIYASIRFRTGDCVPREPGNEWQDVDGKYPNEYYRSVCGTWQYVDDIFLDEEFKEIMKYRAIQNKLQLYVSFLLDRLTSEDRPLLDKCQAAADKIHYWIATIPGRDTLVTSFRHPQLEHSAWCYNTSYVTFCSTNRLSRSWLVANLPTIVLEMDQNKNMFTDQLPANNQEEHESLYDSFMTAYEQWRTLAQMRMKVQFDMIKKREISGRRTNMGDMLEKLRLSHV
jgi:hypothetical protein